MNVEEDTKDKKLLMPKYISLYFSFNLYDIEGKKDNCKCLSRCDEHYCYRAVVRHEQQKQRNVYNGEQCFHTAKEIYVFRM